MQQLGDWMATDEDDSFHHDNFAWGNARTRRKGFLEQGTGRTLDERLKFDNMDRQTGCFNCPKICHNVISHAWREEGSPTSAMPKIPSIWQLSRSWTSAMKCFPSPEEYGVDAYSTPQMIAFALELLEAGILTEKDFPGMPADIRGRFHYLLDMIVRREGIGDILANGVYAAARQIGKGAEKFDHNTTKKFEQIPDQAGQAESHVSS